MDYLELYNKYQTPYYVFDIDELKKRVKYFRKHLPKDTGIVYAVKANTFIIKELEDLVDRFEICSPGEYTICNNLDIRGEKMLISGVYKDYKSTDDMINREDEIHRFTIESLEQYKLLSELCKKYKKNIKVQLRLTSGNQFGMSEEDIYYLASNQSSNIDIVGIQYFSGTQKHNLSIIKKEIDYVKKFIDELESNTKIVIEEVEYGVGFPVFYFNGSEFDEDNYFKELSDYLKVFKGKKLLVETGRGLAASCGSYITKVVDIKKNKIGNYVIVDGGMNHLVYYGQMMAMKVPYFEHLPKKENINIDKYNICGSLCTINDIIIKQVELNDLKLGDLLVFKNTGAYSMTEGIALLLSRDLPKIIIYKNKKDILVRDDFKVSSINCPRY